MIKNPTHSGELFDPNSPLKTPMQITAGNLTLDFTHQCINAKTFIELEDIANTHHLTDRLHALLRGNIVNTSENRPALHTALRDPTSDPIFVNEQNVKPMIQGEMEHMFSLCKTIWQSGITDVLVLGIGGSYWGALSVCEALRHLPKRLNIHFLGDDEDEAFQHVTSQLTPQKTITLIISKSFTTRETLNNAKRASRWLGSLFNIHSIAITANRTAAEQWGIESQHILQFWPWVGGRYSVWSTVGMPIALCYGIAAFNELLKGAYQLDQHVIHASMQDNLPMMAALISFLNTRYLNAQTEAIIPYCARLRHFIPYLQQLSMESLGKSHDIHGNIITKPTGPIVWGQTGLHAQHTFNQILQQGNHFIPIDFILPMDNPALIQACVTQSRTLTLGNVDRTQRHNILKIKTLTPETMGMLMAFYEHKTYLLACLFNVNAFDQFGVELTKMRMHQEALC